MKVSVDPQKQQANDLKVGFTNITELAGKRVVGDTQGKRWSLSIRVLEGSRSWKMAMAAGAGKGWPGTSGKDCRCSKAAAREGSYLVISSIVCECNNSVCVNHETIGINDTGARDEWCEKGRKPHFHSAMHIHVWYAQILCMGKGWCKECACTHPSSICALQACCWCVLNNVELQFIGLWWFVDLLCMNLFPFLRVAWMGLVLLQLVWWTSIVTVLWSCTKSLQEWGGQRETQFETRVATAAGENHCPFLKVTHSEATATGTCRRSKRSWAHPAAEGTTIIKGSGGMRTKPDVWWVHPSGMHSISDLMCQPPFLCFLASHKEEELNSALSVEAEKQQREEDRWHCEHADNFWCGT